MKRTPPFLFYIAYFSAAAFFQPFLILYFQERGYSGIQIGMLAGIVPLVILISTPIWTGLADVKMRHKPILSLTILFCIISAAIFPLVSSFVLIVPLVFIYAICAGPITPLADTATMSMLGEKRELYGRVRLGGTIGWGVMSPVAGLIIQTYGTRWAFWGYSILMLGTLLICQKFTFGQPSEQESMLVNMRKILVDRRWPVFLALAFMGGIAFAVSNNYLFPYLEELGISRSTMGVALFISTLSELPVLFFANHLLARFKARGLFVLGTLITGVRLILYGVFNFQTGILVFQLLNGLTYPLAWVAGVSYANELAPQGMKATAQGLLGAMVFGFGAAAGGLVGGLLLGSLHGRTTFLVIGTFVLVAVGAIVLFQYAVHPTRVEKLA